MASGTELPLDELQRGLAQTPHEEPQLRAVLAHTCARWLLQRGETDQAAQYLQHAVELVPELRPAIRALHRVELEQGNIRQALDYLDQEIRATRHARVAAALYRERGRFVERYFEDLGAAEQCYQAAYRAAPNDLCVLRSIEHCTRELGNLDQTANTIFQQLEIIEDSSLRSAMYDELALFEARRGGNPERAIEFAKHALESQPESPGLITDVFKIAEALHHDELALMALRAEIECNPDPRRFYPIWKTGTWFIDHGDLSTGLTLLHAAAERSANNFSCWRILQDLAQLHHAPQHEIAACLAQIKIIGSGHDELRSDLFYRVGSLALRHFDRADIAISAWKKALSLSPNHATAKLDLCEYLSSKGHWSQLLEIYKHDTVTAGERGLSRTQTAQLYLQTGQLLEEKLGQTEAANKLYVQGCMLAPKYRPVQDRLERSLYRLGWTDRLREYYRSEHTRSEEPIRQEYLLARLSQVKGPANEDQESIHDLKTWLSSNPKDTAGWWRLCYLLRRSGPPEDQLNALLRLLDLINSPECRVDVQRQIANLALQNGNLECARNALVELLKSSPELDLLTRLEQLLRQNGQQSEWIELLKSQCNRDDHTNVADYAAIELARFYAATPESREQAWQTIQLLLQREPHHPLALRDGERWSHQLGDWKSCQAILETKIRISESACIRSSSLLRLATLHATSFNEKLPCRNLLLQALQAWPELGVASSLILSHVNQEYATPEFDITLVRILTGEFGTGIQGHVAREILCSFAENEDFTQRCAAIAATLTPDDFQLTLRQSQIFEQRQQFESAATILASETTSDRKPPFDQELKADLSVLAGQLCERSNQLALALEHYHRAKELFSNHGIASRGIERLTKNTYRNRWDELIEQSQHVVHSSSSRIERATCQTLIADLEIRRGDLKSAWHNVNHALTIFPDYLPALLLKLQLLEKRDDQDSHITCIDTLELLETKISGVQHRSAILCRAGAIGLENPDSVSILRTWSLFARALSIDDCCPLAVPGLASCLPSIQGKKVPTLDTALCQRLKQLDPIQIEEIRDICTIAEKTVSGTACLGVLKQALALAGQDFVIETKIARTHAKLEQWPESIRILKDSLNFQTSPDIIGLLNHYIGECYEKSGDNTSAFDHFLKAGLSCASSRPALWAAERIALSTGDLDKRIAVLEQILSHGEAFHRTRAIQKLTCIYVEQLGQPQQASSRLEQHLKLFPGDLRSSISLACLLHDQDRTSATKILSSKLDEFRSKLYGNTIEEVPTPRVLDWIDGARNLFRLSDHHEGVYMSTALIEVYEPSRLNGPGCDELNTEPWPLPISTDSQILLQIIDSLPNSTLVRFLFEGASKFAGQTRDLPLPMDNNADKLATQRDVVSVAHKLATALNLAPPVLYLDSDATDRVTAIHQGDPRLIIGRRIYAAPFSPRSRENLGRALFRLALGGHMVFSGHDDSQLITLVLELCLLARVPRSSVDRVARKYKLRPRIQSSDHDSAISDHSDFTGLATHVLESINPNTAKELSFSLALGQDRSGVLCAADPRPTVQRLAKLDDEQANRKANMSWFLLSDLHFRLRRSMGYDVDIELNEHDFEELAT